MSFRHVYVTEFLYKANNQKELDEIRKALEEFGTANWHCKGMEGLGYFHGVIKDLNGHDTESQEQEIVDKLAPKVRIKIIIE